MTSYLQKYIAALSSATDYISQWSPNQALADEEHIVPFPTLAIFDRNKQIWLVHVKAWIYLPIETKTLADYLSSLSSLLIGSKNEENIDVVNYNKIENRITFHENKNEIVNLPELKTNVNIDKDPENATASTGDNQENNKDGYSDSYHDLYERAFQQEFDQLDDSPSRLSLFFVGKSGKIVTKLIINGVEHLLQRSDESGFIEHYLELSNEEIQSLCTTTHIDCQDRKFDYNIKVHETAKKFNAKNDDYKTFQCTIYVLAPHGVSIISDIDDTIKFTNAINKTLLLKHTFYDCFEPITGMNELYQKWHEQKCQFHYVSANPWQLYPALRCFLAKYNFPMGTLNLRKFDWNLKFFYTIGTHKMKTISEIISAYPSRKYIFVGDSGELDPEIYAKLYANYSQSIAHIYIRDRTGVDMLAKTALFGNHSETPINYT
ncbi:unnamed protein product [Rotaria socialis]|uniref:Phosphatidate phosphatase APP1 catalytic domain-containing protein n=3 Tax=Rotaria socialis TaxID=392032 RepID=A0A821UHC1_9BILA|nr:unnamed protein product [Rotaria socialis]CAF4365379.1 unnamed protein product [Rotaria socialis]CAF4890018.1 unnamed protein product [Rotaria socialis]